jgi:ribose 5-phosphate isomerase B
MRVYVGADHNGYHMRRNMIEYLKRAGYDVVDEGDTELDPADDYPIFAQKAVTDVLASQDPDARAILLCGSGQGMCMAANRFKGIRAALGYDHESVRASRNDDNANILCMASKTLNQAVANELADLFLKTPFGAAPRYIRRINEIDQMN